MKAGSAHRAPWRSVQTACWVPPIDQAKRAAARNRRAQPRSIVCRALTPINMGGRGLLLEWGRYPCPQRSHVRSEPRYRQHSRRDRQPSRDPGGESLPHSRVPQRRTHAAGATRRCEAKDRARRRSHRTDGDWTGPRGQDHRDCADREECPAGKPAPCDAACRYRAAQGAGARAETRCRVMARPRRADPRAGVARGA